MAHNYYSNDSVKMFADKLNEYRERIEKGENFLVSISQGNKKMGAIPSVSLLPFITCPSVCCATCGKDCYAAKIALLRPAVLDAYARNTAIYSVNPEYYFQQINLYVKTQRFFRWHVSGDIVSTKYLAYMVQIAIKNPHCEFLAFTKQFKIVNAWIEKHGKLADNLHVIFSGWFNLKPENPYNLPETNVYHDETDFNSNWLTCGGNCFECICRGLGCWKAQPGDTIAFKLH